MKLKVLVIASLLIAALAISGCAFPAATPSPSPSPLPAATATATPEPTATPAPAATPTPTPTAVPVYSNGSPVAVTNIKVDWDTFHYEEMARETIGMTVENTRSDAVVLDVQVNCKVTTPATFVNPDGSVENRTFTVTADPQNIGMMQGGEKRDISFHIDHAKNVPSTITVTVQWRGGSAVVFTKTLNLPDHSFGTYEL